MRSRGIRRGVGFGLAVAVTAIVSACATRTAPPVLPAALKYPDFVYPAVPPSAQTSPAAPHIDLGWRFLQNDDLGNADREFAAALKGNAAFYPAHAGEGYVALARRNYDKAVTAFDAALRADRSYVPALVGRGQALLAENKEDEALAAFEQALRVDASLVDLQRRVEVLRFRDVQDVIERARTAAAAGRTDEARVAYERAIAASPDSAFLYRELGMLERKQGQNDRALEHLQKAISLDSTDTAALVEAGALLEDRGEFDAALANYRKAAEIDASADVSARIVGATARSREAKLPPEFRAIAQSPQITRGELAALLGVRLEPLLRAVPPRQAVITDVRSHWAATWITAVLDANVMDGFENHTFQPQGRVRRGDLATAVSRVVTLLAPSRPELAAKLSERPKVADMNADHLNYPAVAVAVSTGVLPLSDGRFQVSRPVTGAEAIDAVTRLQMLAGIR